MGILGGGTGDSPLFPASSFPERLPPLSPVFCCSPCNDGGVRDEVVCCDYERGVYECECVRLCDSVDTCAVANYLEEKEEEIILNKSFSSRLHTYTRLSLFRS